jgi:hypothetical protein
MNKNKQLVSLFYKQLLNNIQLQGALTHALRVEKKALEERIWPLESQNKSEQKIDMHLHQLEDKLGRKTIHLIANNKGCVTLWPCHLH